MLNIFYGELNTDNYIYDPDTYFNNTYEDEWILDKLSVEMIQDIDGSKVIGANLIQSPFLGPIAVSLLSGGVKTLILINNDSEHIFNASACGNNCAKWLVKIGENKDITIRLGYFMNFDGCISAIRVLNTGKVVHTYKELVDEIIEKNLL